MTKFKIQLSYLRPTLFFCIAGLFLITINMLVLIGVENLLSYAGYKCNEVWNMIFQSFTVLAITLPIPFYFFVSRVRKHTNLLIWLFNSFECMFIQVALARRHTDSITLCYVSDGQNGLEFVMTGLMSLPILILLSILFSLIQPKSQ